MALLYYGLPAGMGLPIGAVPLPSLLLQVWALTFVLPAAVIGLLSWLGVVSSVELAERRQRLLPLLLAAACFTGATWLVGRVPHGGLLAQLFFGITVSVLLTALITLRWKISAHGIGMGGAVGLLAWLMLTQRLWGYTAWAWLLVVLALAGAVGWARLELRAHTRAQVVAGLALGAAVALGVGTL